MNENIPSLSRNDAMRALVEKRNAELRANSEPQIDFAAQLERQQAEPTVLNDVDANAYLARARDANVEINNMLAQARAAVAGLPGGAGPESDPISGAVDALFQGEDEQAKASLRAAIAQAQRRDDHGLPEQIDAAVARAERRQSIRSALRQLAAEHPVLMADPNARRTADNFLNEDLVRHGVQQLEQLPPEEISELVLRAGERAVERLGLHDAATDVDDVSRTIEAMRKARNSPRTPSQT